MSSYTINSYNSCTQNSTNFRLQVNNATNYHKSYRKESDVTYRYHQHI